MSKALFAAVLAAGLIAAPRPLLTPTAAAQHAAGRAGKEASQDEEAADAGAARRARASEEVRRRMEGSQGRRQDREGNEVAEILERVQQAPQGRRLAHTKDFLIKRTEGVGETRSLADALCRHRNRGAAEQPHCARRTMTQPGPYDAILETLSRRSGRSY